MSVDRASRPKAFGERGWIPGEPGIWAIIFGDMIVFGILFGSFAYYKQLEPGVFEAGKALLDRGLALANTIVLLTSSALVALSVKLVRKGVASSALPSIALFAAAGLGVTFAVLKSIEWSEKFALGLTIETNDFFMLYFMLCGIHLVHVLVGTGFLLYAAFAVRSVDTSPKTIEGIGVFWHLVDLLWVFLFAIIYLS